MKPTLPARALSLLTASIVTLAVFQSVALLGHPPHGGAALNLAQRRPAIHACQSLSSRLGPRLEASAGCPGAPRQDGAPACAGGATTSQGHQGPFRASMPALSC